MPCNICKSLLLYVEDELTCPKCEKLAVVPYEDSIKIANHFINIFRQLFDNEIKKYHKLHIITNAFWAREKQIRKFYEKYSTLDLARLVSSSLLIRRVIQMDGFQEKETIDDGKIQSIIDTYSLLIKFEEDKSKLQAKNWNMLQFVPYDINHLEKLPLKDSIVVCPNENYDRIMNAFAKHGIMSEKVAEEKMKEFSKDFIKPVPGSKKSYTSKETIHRFYELISMFYVGFFRSRVYTEAFGLPDEKIMIDPIGLKKLISLYPIHPEGVSSVNLNEFQGIVLSRFGGKYKQFFENFVMSEDNISATPLFLKFNDIVLLSQAFTELYSYVLHAIINKDDFNDETIRRSKIYESQIVKENFEKNNFYYIPNHVVKNKMEIDGIAISNSLVYVIEVKGWGSKRLLEEQTSKKILEKEIRNAIDGLHVDVKSGKKRKRVSLPRKVSWLTANKNRFNISESAQIVGLLVINEPPPLSEYNGCKVMFVDDFEFIKTGHRR